MAKSKISQAERQQLVESLVEELTKEKPSKSAVRALSLKLGIPCSGDQLTDIDTVLHSMGSVYLRTPRRRELSQLV